MRCSWPEGNWPALVPAGRLRRLCCATQTPLCHSSTLGAVRDSCMLPKQHRCPGSGQQWLLPRRRGAGRVPQGVRADWGGTVSTTGSLPPPHLCRRHGQVCSGGVLPLHQSCWRSGGPGRVPWRSVAVLICQRSMLVWLRCSLAGTVSVRRGPSVGCVVATGATGRQEARRGQGGPTLVRRETVFRTGEAELHVCRISAVAS